MSIRDCESRLSAFSEDERGAEPLGGGAAVGAVDLKKKKNEKIKKSVFIPRHYPDFRTLELHQQILCQSAFVFS
jgi:hypothetical protein